MDDVLGTLVSGGLVVAALIHLAPVPGVLGAKRLSALYGFPIEDKNLAIVMRHRAVLFGLLGTLMLVAAFDRALQPMALGAGFISVLSFFWITYSERPYNSAIRRVVLADVIALVGLILSTAAWCCLALFAAGCAVDRSPLATTGGSGGSMAAGSGGEAGTGGVGGSSGQDAGGGVGAVGGTSGSSSDAAALDAHASDAAHDATISDADLHDAQVDGSAPPLGTATPGNVVCAGLPCMVDAFPPNICCVGAAPFPTSCFPTFPGCVNAVIATISCDDAADCENGMFCCGSLSGQVLGASCTASCPGPAFQVCRTAAECASNDCQMITQAPDYGRCAP